MFNVFNMGIGMIAIIDDSDQEIIEKVIPNSKIIGSITKHLYGSKIKLK